MVLNVWNLRTFRHEWKAGVIGAGSQEAEVSLGVSRWVMLLRQEELYQGGCHTGENGRGPLKGEEKELWANESSITEGRKQAQKDGWWVGWGGVVGGVGWGRRREQQKSGIKESSLEMTEHTFSEVTGLETSL